jgi:hypothetical protein
MARIFWIARNVAKCSGKLLRLKYIRAGTPHSQKNTYAGGLFESGMLVLRGTALESAREMGHTADVNATTVAIK